MKTKQTLFAVLSFACLVFCAGDKTFAQNQSFDISSGGQPTITGTLNGSVSGSSDPTQNLTVTINFGEVSPANPNSAVKVTVPIAVRSTSPYQVTVAMTGSAGVDSRAIQLSDIGFGINNMRVLGSKAQTCTRSSHIIQTPFNNDPSNTAMTSASGRVTYQSTLNNISGSTVVLTGPKLTQGTSFGRRNDDGWVFDAVFVITPQFFSTGSTNATLTFTISSGPNVSC